MTLNQPLKSEEDRLELLYHLSQAFNSSLDLDEVLNRVMDEVIGVMRAERGFVMLGDQEELELSKSGTGKLTFRVARGMDQVTIEDPQFQISRSVVERVARDGLPVITTDAQADTRFSTQTSVVLLGLRSLLCVPLLVKDKVIGVVYVDNRWHTGVFTQPDLDLLSAIASSAAIAIENARLYQVAIEKGRMERELQMAHKVQASLLPQQIPDMEGWEFACRWKPAREVGGDYYDFIPLPDDNLGILIADVTDKGMPAALFMASTRSILRACMLNTASPAEGITQANTMLTGLSEDVLFVSMFYAQINRKNGEIIYVNAGHNPPLFFQTFGQQIQLGRLKATGMQLGVDVETTFAQNTTVLRPGDYLLLYTDGVTDALDREKNEFGMERLQRALLSCQEKSAQDILNTVQKEIDDFTGSETPFDDITMLVIKRIFM